MQKVRKSNEINRLEFHISYTCLNNCVFCSERDQLEKYKGRFVSKNDIIKKLTEFSNKGFNHVSFTGGEPTYHPEFIKLIRLAKKLGYKVYISSNGGLFSSKHFCKQALPYVDEISFSIHGHNAKLHNYHTRNHQSFKNLTRALENIENARCNVYGFINIVLTPYNHNYLCRIISFVSRYKKINQILISNLAPEGNGLHNFSKLAIKLGAIKGFLDKLVELARDKSLVLRFFGIPLCVLGNYYKFSNDLYWSPRLTVEKRGKNGRVFLRKTLSYKPTRKRLQTKKCRQCSQQNVCGGIFRKYYQEFGDSELISIIKQF